MFAGKPHTYNTDHTRIIFAASYFTELAQSHYSHLLQAAPQHPALHQWADFVTEFGGLFGIYDQTMDAQIRLSHAVMTNRQHFSSFLVRFQEMAALSGFNDSALRSWLYRAIAPRLRESMQSTPMPSTYPHLVQLLLHLDHHYWNWRYFENSLRTTQRSRASTPPMSPAPSPPPRVQTPIASEEPTPFAADIADEQQAVAETDVVTSDEPQWDSEPHSPSPHHDNFSDTAEFGDSGGDMGWEPDAGVDSDNDYQIDDTYIDDPDQY